MASVDRWKGNKWRARYRDPDGASRSRVFDRKVDAERFLVSVQHAKRTDAYVDPSAGRLISAAGGRSGRRWRRSNSARRRSPGTSPTGGRSSSRLRGPAIARVDHMTVQRWVSELSDAREGPGDRREGIPARRWRRRGPPSVPGSSRMTRPRGFACRRSNGRRCGSSPPPRSPDSPRSSTPRYRALVLLGAYGGLRLRRARRATTRTASTCSAAGVDVLEIVVEVKGHHHVGPPKTRAGRRGRATPPRRCRRARASMLAGLDPSQLVFPAPEGGPLRASLFRRRVWHPAIEAAGRRTAPHPRPAAHGGGFLDRRRASPKEVAARAGHASVGHRAGPLRAPPARPRTR